jgi:hypothetical protein
MHSALYGKAEFLEMFRRDAGTAPRERNKKSRLQVVVVQQPASGF